MGCEYSSPVAASLGRETAHDKRRTSHSSLVEDSFELNDVAWKSIPSAELGRSNYVSDGTLTTNAGKDQLECRSMLDEPTALKALLKFARTTDSENIIHCWSDIQLFKTCDPCNRLDMAMAIYRKYIHLENHEAFDTIMDAEIESELQRRIQYCCSTKQIPDISLFQTVQKECFDYFFVTCFMKFKHTSEYSSLVRALKRKYNHCSPKDFLYMERLGEGAYGLVVHVKKKTTGEHYAMKIQTKVALLNLHLEDPGKVEFEVQALAACDHPYISRLDYAFATDSVAVMVLSLCNGEDMGKVIRGSPNGRLPENRVRFYTAEIVSALAHMHSKGLMYRDLKPANILLDSTGHIKLIDMGAVGDVEGETLNYSEPAIASSLINSIGSKSKTSPAGVCSPSRSVAPADVGSDDSGGSDMFTIKIPKRAMSVVGTMGYMAPEVVIMTTQAECERTGYTYAADYWSLGVTMFAMLVGRKPFENPKASIAPNRTPEQIASREGYKNYQSLMHEVHFPDHVSEHARSIIKEFLNVDPTVRLGAMGDQTLLRAHPYFDEIKWHLIESMLAVPPYIPEVVALNDEPLYASFKDMMREVGRDDWLRCAPPAYLDKYFNSWNYSSELVIGTERYISQTRSASTSLISNSTYARAHGSSSGEEEGGTPCHAHGISPIMTPTNSVQRMNAENHALFRDRIINVLPTIIDVATPCGDSVDGSIGSRIGASGSCSVDRPSLNINRSINKSFEMVNNQQSVHSPRFELSAVYENLSGKE